MTTAQLRIIGIGNPLMGDDGLGIAALELLQQQALPPQVELIDGGCGGLSLLPLLTECRQAIIIDAADFGAPAGRIKILTESDLPLIPAQNSRPSSHQPGLAEIILLLEKLQQLPHLTLILMQAHSCAPGYGLSLSLQSALPDLVQRVLRTLQTA